MDKKSAGTLALTALLSLTFLSSCGDKGGTDVKDFDYVNDKASAEVARNGHYESFVDASYEDRTEILGKLEDYAIENNLTGVTLYDDGGYVKYSDRVQIPTKVISTPTDDGKFEYNGVKYVTPIHENVLSYGFGILSEGKLNGKLSGINDAYGDYLRNFESDNLQTLNYMDDKGSVVGNYHPYISGLYFDTRLTESKDAYEEFPALATDFNMVEGKARPRPLDKDGKLIADPKANELHDTYRIYVKTGKDGAKYNLHKNSKYFDKWDGKGIELQDYVTTFQELHCQKNGLARAAENLNDASAIKGMSEYYEATAEGFSQEAWDKVGLKTGTDDNGSYIEVTYKTPCTPFYAMYYINSSTHVPLPKAFLDEIGGIKNYAANTADGKTIVDTALSSGPYVVQVWGEKEFAFSKADDITEAQLGGKDRYQIPGVHVAINDAVKNDKLAAWKEFSANKYDSVAIPKDKLKAEKTTKNTQITRGSSTTKLNVNTCTPELWEQLFGENGQVMQTQPSDYYKVKPIMSDKHFLKGLGYAINRQEFADAHGVTPSNEYFSDNYLIDPENGISYNSTEAHEKVMEKHYGETNKTFGYDLDKAVAEFQLAAKNLKAMGFYKDGDKIDIEITWMFEHQIEGNGTEIKNYITTAWNKANTGLTLNINNTAVAEWTDVYYERMMKGQFDIAFGGISGNPFNPINFMEVLKSDNSSGFTLNYGADTNEVGIAYKDKTYSFDGLFQAADTGAILDKNGAIAKTYNAALAANVANKDLSRELRIKVGASNITDVVETKLTTIYVVWNEAPEDAEKTELELVAGKDFQVVNGEVVLTIDKETAQLFQGSVTIQVVFEQSMAGNDPVIKFTELNTLFPTK